MGSISPPQCPPQSRAGFPQARRGSFRAGLGAVEEGLLAGWEGVGGVASLAGDGGDLAGGDEVGKRRADLLVVEAGELVLAAAAADLVEELAP